MKGYIRITSEAVSPEDMWIYLAMRRRVPSVLEHRFVMAKNLGRPLAPHELVDHMDGNKLNNTIENLRIYRRGKNEPGDHSGYGTYYHEWQAALARVRELEKSLHVQPSVLSSK